MKKITSMIASALLLMGLSANAQITSPVMSTGKLLTAEELNASTGTKRIAIQLAHQGDFHFWYTATAKYRQNTFDKSVIYEWEATTNGHYLKKVSGEANQNFIQQSRPIDLGAQGTAEVISVVKPAEGGSGNTVVDPWDGNCPAKNDPNNKYLCRFLNGAGTHWINANQPGWNQGKGAWTIFYAYDLTNHVDGQVKFSAVEGSAVTGLEAGSKIATFSSPVATKLPVGVRAFYVETAAAGDPVAKLKEIKDNIPAEQGVILVSKKDVEVMTAAEGNVAALPASALKGSVNEYARGLQDKYVLATKDGVTQFYKTSGNLAPNKAYLELSAANAATVALNFPGEATAIEGVKAEANENAPVYDLSGRKVNDTLKGNVYIQNGKKFIVK